MANRLQKYASEIVISLLLLFCIAGVYGQVVSFDFVAIDDGTYVKDNYVVKQGISFSNIAWAFTAMYAANWHPLTWISHMLDIELFGFWPGMHHLINLILHVLNTILLFVMLRYSTGAVWKSAAVAALFALHPLHVESVAWIAERKDVLSTLFWMLTMLGYAWYAKRPSPYRYMFVAASFAMGLMAKPMLVTLPFVLLLFDLWPLGRLASGGRQPYPCPAGQARAPGFKWSAIPFLIAEKVPLMVMSGASSVLTFIAQKNGGAVNSLDSLSVGARVSNALMSYAAYLWKMIWPVNLAVFYPLERSIGPVVVAGASLLLVLVTAATLFCLKKRPYLLFGWLWYLGTLVPVIGLVQVGAQSMADRYTYVPLIGIFIMAVWGLADTFGRMHLANALMSCLFCIILGILMALTWAQVGTWKESASLFTHAIGITKKNHLSYNNLGCALYEKGDLEGAIKNFSEALKVYPNYAVAHANLGLAYEKQGKREQALNHYLKAMKLESATSIAHYTIGRGLYSLGRVQEAIREYEKVLKLDPNHAAAWNSMGLSLDSQGKHYQGQACYLRALKIKPDYLEARLNLSMSLERQGRMDEAIFQIKAALEDHPGNRALADRLAVLSRKKNP